jgi:patatin-related protein
VVAPAQPRSREVRFGLVMYGGVSLAIYINGVCHEFFRAVRGDGVFRLLKILTDSDVVVDIASGSSAGGINGIFLCFALANDKDFGGMAQLWREQGDIQRLLRKIDSAPEATQSLLDSEGFYEPQLQSALTSLPDCPRGDYDPTRNELDLFITGTNVDGEVYTVIDDDGHPIDVKDHRTVFWLKHRSGRKEPFKSGDPVTSEALARLARLTSCFPAAFAPVHVEEGPRGTANPADGVDARLRRWGDFSNERYFLDGGVLNNKPFSHTIQAIFRRTQTRPVERYLAYVEPDPEFFPQAKVKAPSFLKATIDGAFGIKSYESIADDLRLISQHNSEVDRYWQVCHELRGHLPSDVIDELKQGGGRGGVVLPPSPFSQTQGTLHVRSRFSAIAQRALKGLLTKDGDPETIPREQRDRVFQLVRALAELKPGSATPNVLSDDESLFRFDIYLRLRRLYHVTYRLAEVLRHPATAPPADWTALWERLNLQTEIAEILRYSLEYVMDHAAIAWKDGRAPIEVWNDVRWYMERFLAVDPANPIPIPTTVADLGAFHQRLLARAKIVAALQRDPLRDPLSGTGATDFNGLLALIDESARNAFFADDQFKKEFVEYVALDAMVYPLEFVSDLESKDRIRTLRISPRDAQSGFSRRPVQDKLAGDAFAHFGGFFKRSWRSNDIMWGRLDSVCELMRALLSEERLREIAETQHLREHVRAQLPDEDSLRRLVGDRCPQTVAQTHAWIHDLLSDDAQRRADALTKERLCAMVERLTEVAQLEILHECVPAVIKDAVTQQADWNQYAEPTQLSKLQRRRLLAKARKIQDGSDQEAADVKRCLGFAEPTGRDRAAMGQLWLEMFAKEPKRVADWDKTAPDGLGTYGDRVLTRAIDASYLSTEGRAPGTVTRWRFRPTEGFVDATVAARASEHFASASTAELADDRDPALRPAEPRKTKMGRFFLNEYRVGSEDIWSGIPWLVSLQVLAHAGLVLRSCLLGALSPERRKKVMAHVLYRFGFDLPVRAVHALVLAERQRPGLIAMLWMALVGGSLTSLTVVVLLQGSFLHQGWHPEIWRSLIFLVLPALILYVHARRLLRSR